MSKFTTIKKLTLSAAALCAATLGANAHAVNCSGVQVWNSTGQYTGTTQVQTAGKAYVANWWSQGADPVTHSAQYQEWTLQGTCDGTTSSAVASSIAASSKPASSIPASSKPASSIAASSTPASSIAASSVGGGLCTSPQYVAGTTYNAGQLVQNGGNEYSCKIGGWCSSTAAWAYAPGTGSAWTDAWALVRSCTAGASSSVKSSTASIAASSSSVASSTAASTSSVNNGLPKHALVGYWHNFNNGSGFIRLADVDSVWDVIVIAFADDAGNGSVAFNLDSAMNKAQFIADVATKRAQGKKVILSFGGQNGTVTLNNATNVTNFVNSTAAILNEYGFDGIDLDLESGAGVSLGAPIITNLPIAVKQLKTKFPNLYLSMAPEHPYVQGGFTAYSGIWGAYLPIIDSLRNELSILHVQLYNNGSLYTPYGTFGEGTEDIMVASSLMLIEGFKKTDGTMFVGLRPDQIAVGVPSGSHSANTGFVTPANVDKTLTCLTKLVNCATVKPSVAYPTFRGMMTWSINWDVADGRPFSVPVSTSLKALP